MSAPSNAINAVDYLRKELDALSARLQVDDECMQHLCALYEKIWPEACYDPMTKETEKFARDLLPHIQALNAKLKFKR